VNVLIVKKTFQGLSGYRLDTIGHINFLQKHSIPVLRAFLRTIGENFNDDVCFSSLDGLSKVIPQLPGFENFFPKRTD